jgi:uncharacterized membrane protein
MKKNSPDSSPKNMKYKYSWGERVPSSGVFECSICENLQAFKKEEFFSQCQDCINRHEVRENRWYVTNEFTYFISKNTNVEFEEIEGIHLKIADKITEWSGNIWFVYIHIIWFGLWIWINLGDSPFTARVFDPYPFGLLTMIVSLEAIFLATFIMISQNLLSKKNAMRDEHEYQVNLETERNVAEILALVKEIREEAKLKGESIEEIKDTIAEIAPSSIPEPVDAQPTVEDVPLEAIEKEHFEEQEQILQEAGIDVMPESAPPVVLEDVKEKKKRGRKKKTKEAIESSTESNGENQFTSQ